jgi:hypothetical protein
VTKASSVPDALSSRTIALYCLGVYSSFAHARIVLKLNTSKEDVQKINTIATGLISKLKKHIFPFSQDEDFGTGQVSN